MKRSIFDLRPAKQEKLDDLAGLAQYALSLDIPRGRKNAALAAQITNRAIAQFIAVRACLRMPM